MRGGSCGKLRRREGVSPRALKKIKFNSLLSLSCFSAALSGCLHFFSRHLHSVNPRSPEGRGGYAAPSGGRLPDRPLRCSASSAPRRLFFVATSRTLCDVAEGTLARASVCALQLSALSNVVIFRLSLSLNSHVCLCCPLSLSLNTHVLCSLSVSLTLCDKAATLRVAKPTTTKTKPTTTSTNPPAHSNKKNKF